MNILASNICDRTFFILNRGPELMWRDFLEVTLLRDIIVTWSIVTQPLHLYIFVFLNFHGLSCFSALIIA